MDEKALGPEEGPLQRARLHIRGGRRRLRQGKIPEGIVTLYDAVCAALEWYFASQERRARLIIRGDDDLNDDKILYEILRRSGILDSSFDYGAFNELVDGVLYRDLSRYDHEGVLRGVESVMTQIGVMPFDEQELPPEDPSTF
jgi:hypothetical protein